MQINLEQQASLLNILVPSGQTLCDMLKLYEEYRYDERLMEAMTYVGNDFNEDGKVTAEYDFLQNEANRLIDEIRELI